MRPYIQRLLLLSFLIACVSISCKTQEGAQSSSKKKSGSELNEKERINLTYTFHNANREKMLGNYDKAAQLFSQCIRIDGGNHASMYELAKLYVADGKINDALFFASSAVQIDKKNVWYKLLLADIYERSNQPEEATKIYQKLAEDNPSNLDYHFRWANSLAYQGKNDAAIAVYNKIENDMGISPELSDEKKRLYLKTGKVDKAAAEIEKLIVEFPEEYRFYSNLAEIYLVNGYDEKAEEVIERILKLENSSPYLNLTLAEYYRGKGEKEKSFQQLVKAFSSPDLDSGTKIQILTSYLPMVQADPKMMDQALELSKTFAEANPKEVTARAIYADFLSLNNKTNEAREQYRAAVKLDKNNFNIWQQLLICESELRDFDAMLKESDEALELFPSQPIFYLLNGVAKSQKEMHEEAIKVLNTGRKMVVDNDLQVAEFYSNLGDNHNSLKQYTASDEAYDKSIAIDPNNAYVLNNYAYYLSLRKEKLDKAAKMSKLSNELVPNNASFEDTYAWIMYTQSKYTEALEWIEKAVKNGSGSAVIFEHYGDILYKLDRKEEALQNWKEAARLGKGSELLEKKIAEKKLYE
ncbi:MAG: tetratricopeptide repeat protein [Bacteroidia bacterium]|nr:tetratricopeptide repeat protein [Bacteroidia bacterium]